jgi:hypothetical protein
MEKTKREIFTKKKKDGARTQKGPSGTQPQQNFLKNGGMQEGHAGAAIAAAAATLGCYSFVLGVMLLILLLQRGGSLGGDGDQTQYFWGGRKIPITLGTLLASYSNKHKLKKKHTHIYKHIRHGNYSCQIQTFSAPKIHDSLTTPQILSSLQSVFFLCLENLHNPPIHPQPSHWKPNPEKAP